MKIREVHLAVESTCDKFGFQLAKHILKFTRRLVGKLGILLNGGGDFLPIGCAFALVVFAHVCHSTLLAFSLQSVGIASVFLKLR